MLEIKNKLGAVYTISEVKKKRGIKKRLEKEEQKYITKSNIKSKAIWIVIKSGTNEWNNKLMKNMRHFISK